MAPINHSTPLARMASETTAKPAFMLVLQQAIEMVRPARLSTGSPKSVVDFADQRRADGVAQHVDDEDVQRKAGGADRGRVTLARIVFDGPVLKNRPQQVMKIMIQAAGNGTKSAARKNGKAMSMPHPETRK